MNKRITALWKFLTYDIWRITEDEVTKTTFSLYNIIKTIYLCINRFTKDRLVNNASALTYSTLLAIVPILAILFAIARGFGFSNLIALNYWIIPVHNAISDFSSPIYNIGLPAAIIL